MKKCIWAFRSSKYIQEARKIILTFKKTFKLKYCGIIVEYCYLKISISIHGEDNTEASWIPKARTVVSVSFGVSLFLISLKIPKTVSISQHSMEKEVLCSLHVCISAYWSTKYWHDNCSQAWMNSGLWEFSWCCTNWMAAQDTVWNARCKLALYSAQAGII